MTGDGTDWVRVAALDDLHPGAVQGAQLGEEQIVVWRTTSGRVCAAVDRCPHQWSSLCEEGLVLGEQLVCQAHGWRFAPDGAGSKVAMSGRVDPKEPVATFPVEIRDGGVWVGGVRVGGS